MNCSLKTEVYVRQQSHCTYPRPFGAPRAIHLVVAQFPDAPTRVLKGPAPIPSKWVATYSTYLRGTYVQLIPYVCTSVAAAAAAATGIGNSLSLSLASQLTSGTPSRNWGEDPSLELVCTYVWIRKDDSGPLQTPNTKIRIRTYYYTYHDQLPRLYQRS